MENSTFTKQMPRRRFEVSETEYKQLDDLPFSFSSGKLLYAVDNFRMLMAQSEIDGNGNYDAGNLPGHVPAGTGRDREPHRFPSISGHCNNYL